MRDLKFVAFFKELLPFLLMAVLLLWVGCAPSVRYTRPSSSKTSSAYKQKTTKASKNNLQKDSKTLDTSAVVADIEGSDNLSETVVDNCGLRKTIDTYVGIPYKYGGVDRRGLDCSGLVYRVFKDLGYDDFVRTSSEVMYSMGTPVSKRKIQPGDLVFFKKRGKINHVGIYMGNREFAHSSSTIGVSYTTLDNEYFKNKFVGARRLYQCQ